MDDELQKTQRRVAELEQELRTSESLELDARRLLTKYQHREIEVLREQLESQVEGSRDDGA